MTVPGLPGVSVGVGRRPQLGGQIITHLVERHFAMDTDSHFLPFLHSLLK